ncbi:MAG: outer membrane beta-barrel protein [Marinifilaceae bacterium]
MQLIKSDLYTAIPDGDSRNNSFYRYLNLDFTLKGSLCFLFILLHTVVCAKEYKGKVTDMNGKSIPDAAVLLDGTDFQDFLVTDVDGIFYIQNAPDVVEIIVSCLGYEKFTRTVRLHSLGEELLHIQLATASIELEEATIKAEAISMKRELGKFVVRDIDKSPFGKGTNLSTFLRFVPLLDCTNGLKILNKKQPAEVYINGRPATVPLEAIPSKNVARIEIMPIPGVEYGVSTKKGVINVILKRDLNHGTLATIDLSSTQSYYNSQRGSLYLSQKGKKISATTYVSASNGKSYVNNGIDYYFSDTFSRQTIDRENNNTNKSIQGGTNLEFILSPQSKLGVNVYANTGDNNKKNKATTEFSSDMKIDSVKTSLITTHSPAKLNYGVMLYFDKLLDERDSKFSGEVFYCRSNGENEVKGEYKDIDPIEKFTTRYGELETAAGDFASAKMSVVKKYENDNVLKYGAQFKYFNNDNNLTHTLVESNDNEIERLNYFRHKTKEGAAYFSFDKILSDKWELSVGVRGEYYFSEGKQLLTTEPEKIETFDLLPMLSLLYLPSNKHELALDVIRFTTRPTLSNLNPFIRNSSTTTYIQHNPNLQPCKSVESMLSYTYNHFLTLNLEYLYDKDVWSDFQSTDDDGLIRQTTANYGDAHTFSLTLILQKFVFNGRWHINGVANAIFDNSYGSFDDIDIDTKAWSFGYKLNSSVFLDRNRKWINTISYNYGTKSKGPSMILPKNQNLMVELRKVFNKGSITLMATNFLTKNLDIRSNYNSSNLSYINRMTNYPTVSMSVQFILGNEKVKKLSNRYLIPEQ